MSNVLGYLIYYIFPIRKSVMIKNLNIAFGKHMNDKEIKRIALRCYIHLIGNIIEFCRLPVSLKKKEINIDVNGDSNLRDALKKDKGVLILTAHVGNWDLLCCAYASRGLKLNVVTKSAKINGINRFWHKQRELFGVKQIEMRGAAPAIFRALRRGEVVAITLDQHRPPGKGIMVDFFGTPASTSPALADIALRTGCPVIPAFSLRQSDGRHIIWIGEPIQSINNGEGLDDLIRRNTELYNKLIERFIMKQPEQWLWIHRRWKQTVDYGFKE
jgi:KDO2-lipid IV(A) lauroyltransferase